MNIKLWILFATGLSLFLEATAQQKQPAVWEARLLYPLPADTNTIQIQRNINYARKPDSFTLLDIYKPSAQSKSNAPVVLLVHGGPVSPAIPVKPKDWTIYKDYGKLLASKGLCAVVLNHRLFDKENMTQSRMDLLDAIEYVKKNAATYQLQSNAIGIWMFSFGGTHVDFFAQGKDSTIKALVSFYGFLDVKSATTDVASFKPAQLIVRCGLDKPTLLSFTDRYIAQALQRNYSIEIVNYSDGKHAFDMMQPTEQTQLLIDKAIAFLQQRLSVH